MWQVQPLAKRYLRGAPPVERLDGAPPDRARRGGLALGPRHPATRDQPRIAATRARGTSIMPAMGWLLGGYAAVTALVSWMLSKGRPEPGPILALAPLSLLISILVAISALGVVVFGGRRHLVLTVGTLGLAVGVAVASAGAMLTASF